MKRYDKWREKEIKRVGGILQRKAEEHVEKQEKADFVTLVDDTTGKSNNYRANVADRLEKRPQYHRPRKVFSIPYCPFLHGDNNGNC